MQDTAGDILPVWVEVNLDAVRHNVQEIRRFIGAGVRLMAVVKADAYGHGAVPTSKAILQAGADSLAVTRLGEGLELRNSGIRAPILILDSTLPELAAQVVSADLEQTLCSMELAQALSQAALQQGKTIRVHIKIDTGMGRLGVLPQDALEFARNVAALPGIEIAGTFTHFATALDRNTSPMKAQLDRFLDVLKAFEIAGLSPGVAHAANSAALIRLPESHLDMVRPGTLIYGQYPSRYVPRSLDLRETWQLKARISFIKRVPSGHPVGYGGEFRTRRDSTIAVLPVGFADGLSMLPESVARRRTVFPRCVAEMFRPSGTLSVTIRGMKAPIVGRVAMQMCMVDVTDIPGVAVGDEVIIPARRLAVSPRIPRIYSSSGWG